jgi:hypothetical protein
VASSVRTLALALLCNKALIPITIALIDFDILLRVHHPQAGITIDLLYD